MFGDHGSDDRRQEDETKLRVWMTGDVVMYYIFRSLNLCEYVC